MKKICPRCGISSEEREFAGPFCVACTPVKIECPTKVIVYSCQNCGRREQEAEKLALKGCKGKYESAHFDSARGEAVFLVKSGGAFMEVRRAVELRVRERMCASCSRQSGGYFEGIIQLRGNAEKAAKLSEKLQAELERKSFVAKVEELKEGIDIYAGDKKAAEEILKKRGLKFTRSDKLAGEKDGKRLYRSSFCVRL